MDRNCPLNGNLNISVKRNVKPIRNSENIMKNITPYVSKDLIAAAGFNVETPVVNAIIGNLTGTLPTKRRETEMIKCDICDCELSSSVVLSFHINGSKHKKKLKALEIIEQLKEGKDKGVQLGSCNNPNALRCEICSLTVNSAQQLEIHLSGAKHKKKVAKIAISESDLPNSNKCYESNENTDNSSCSPPKRRKKEEQKLMSCDICNIFLNSQIQYDQHLLSKKHLSKVNVNQSNRKF